MSNLNESGAEPDSSPLLRLPTELRLIIWGFLIQGPVHVKLKPTEEPQERRTFRRAPPHKTDIPRMAEELGAILLSTCQKIANESVPLMEKLPFIMALSDVSKAIGQMTRAEKRRIKHVWITVGPHDENYSGMLHDAMHSGLRYIFKLETITFILPPPMVGLEVQWRSAAHCYLVYKAKVWHHHDPDELFAVRTLELTRGTFLRLLQDPTVKAAFAKYPDFNLEPDPNEDWRVGVERLLQEHPEAKDLFGRDCKIVVWPRSPQNLGQVVDITKELANKSHWFPNTTCTWKVVDWKDIDKI
ncbi:hypothetical protein BU16DRAFT_541607 [Lophium mytilinum]|uniref:Uncharacterized protein n=1 Tax=Lophium mytilinum TaxID=390894 RepID=A0A6A6QK37_9PEZI|nr:hypothetical protein BU16DRAFT_541607 [Lophium mytilinum]